MFGFFPCFSTSAFFDSCPCLLTYQDLLDTIHLLHGVLKICLLPVQYISNATPKGIPDYVTFYTGFTHSKRLA